MALIRAAGIRGFGDLVRDHGGDPEALATRAGLPVAALSDDELIVEDLAMGTVLELAATELGLPDFGLRLAERQDITMLGALAVAIQNSPTLGDAMECTSRYLFVHARGLSVEVVADPQGDPACMAIQYGPSGLATGGLGGVLRQGLDLGLGFVHRAITLMAGGPYGLRGVELPHHPLAPLARYEDFFGVPVRTGRQAAVLRVPTTLSDEPMGQANQTLRRLALDHLDHHAPRPGGEVGAQVGAVLEQQLGTSSVEIADVASLLAMHPRTLQRRLEAEGGSFAQILDTLRATRARTFLTTTDMPMSQIAAALGLSEQSALSRCSRRWWGRTPLQVRQGA